MPIFFIHFLTDILILFLTKVVNNISTCFNSQTNKATTKQAEVAESILNKKEQHHIFQLDSPLASMGCLLLNDLEISISLTVTENLSFFCSHVQGLKPKILIDEIYLIPQLCLLRENLMTSINRRLLSHNLQIPYITYVTKIHTVPSGMLDSFIHITLR